MHQDAARHISGADRPAECVRRNVRQGVALDRPDQRVPVCILPELESTPGAQGAVFSKGVHVRAIHARLPEQGQTEDLVQARPATGVRVDAGRGRAVAQEHLKPPRHPMEECLSRPGLRQPAQGGRAPHRR